MTNIIKIKRSQVTSTPASLAEGELAYSENSSTLFIGTSGGNVSALAGVGALVNDFNRISVSGETDIVSDQSGDTLNFAGGAGVSITTNPSTDTVTITNSSTNVSTDLSIGTKTSTTLDVDSSDGTNATIPSATSTEAGLLTSTQYTKLDYITVSGAVDLGDIALKLDKSGDTMSGDLVMSGNSITGLSAPINSGDATNKAYVDGNLAGLSWKNAVIAATAGDVDLDGPETIDGVSVVAGDRVLVMNQTLPANNGIYEVKDGAWTRATDFDDLTPTDEINGAAVYVEQGTIYATAGFTVSSVVVTIGTSPIVFTQFNGASGITDGIGLIKTGNTLDVNLGAGIGELPSDEIGVEVYPTGGLITTSDGTTSSTVTSAQLAILLDGNTLSLSSSGIRLDSGVVDDLNSKVEGPASSLDGNVALFDGTTGKLVKSSNSIDGGSF